MPRTRSLGDRALHVRDDMASVYRERISEERLRAVTEHVRKWLFGTKAAEMQKTAGSS